MVMVVVQIIIIDPGLHLVLCYIACIIIIVYGMMLTGISS